jgi:HAD superfamily hydrolase (TIGR01549 family)
VNSRVFEEARRLRQWQYISDNISEIVPYKGILRLLTSVHDKGIPISIVTNSPVKYCREIIRNLDMPIDYTVTYWDTKLHKPSPEPILLAIERMNDNQYPTISVGDDCNDIIASNRAGVISIAALWDASCPKELLQSRPTYVAYTIAELHDILIKLLN